MNQQPKTSYQDFLKDIYSSMKKINQTTGDIFAKLDTLDIRIANLEKSYVLLSEDVKKLINTEQTNLINSPIKQSKSGKLLSLLTQLNDSANDITDTGLDVYKLGTSTVLESIKQNSNGSSPINSTTYELSPPDDTDYFGLQPQYNATDSTLNLRSHAAFSSHNSSLVEAEKREREVGLSFTAGCTSYGADDFMILE